jgi:purine-nucleoside phosphorylase
MAASPKSKSTRPDPKVTAAQWSKVTHLRPRLAVVLGSGFQSALSRLRVEAEIPFNHSAGFAQPSVPGHAGRVVFGCFGDEPVCVLSGRLHFYEGNTLDEVTFPVRALAEFGVGELLLTNAAGGINSRFRPGDFMSLTDHINLMGVNPLRGLPEPGRERFVDLTHAYDERLTGMVRRAAKKVKATLHSGVYLAVCGPSYETPAEIRAFARLGADAVGMSTVPEVIVARQCGLAVTAVSCITNFAAGKGNALLSHADVLAAGERVKETSAALVEQFVKLHAANA